MDGELGEFRTLFRLFADDATLLAFLSHDLQLTLGIFVAGWDAN